MHPIVPILRNRLVLNRALGIIALSENLTKKEIAYMPFLSTYFFIFVTIF